MQARARVWAEPLPQEPLLQEPVQREPVRAKGLALARPQRQKDPVMVRAQARLRRRALMVVRELPELVRRRELPERELPERELPERVRRVVRQPRSHRR
jgi:hypothetical protein